jgi:hypothetical protein
MVSAIVNGLGPDIISFEADGASPEPAKEGVVGALGSKGGTVTISGAMSAGNSLRVNLRGQNGGAGGAGRNGAPGASGTPGANGADSLFGCTRGGATGEAGHAGEDGAPGSIGGNGGDGGDLVLIGKISDQGNVIFEAPPGRRGPGGPGGQGGSGGVGGPGGGGTVYCHGGQAGPAGARSSY